MTLEQKALPRWAAYATILWLAFASIHGTRPDPVVGDPSQTPARRPILTVTSGGDLDRDGAASLRIRLDGPAGERIEIAYRLGHEVLRPGLDYAVEPPSPLVIERGGLEASLTIKKKEPNPPPGKPLRERGVPDDLIVSLPNLSGVGLELAPGTRTSWPFRLTPTEFVAPSQVSMIAPGDFREPDARRREERTIVFELDRLPTDRAASIRYAIKGTADPSDFEVVDAPRDKTLFFSPKDGKASLTLRRLPGLRGRGDRKIRVECEPPAGGEIGISPGRGYAEIGILDPEPKLSWSVVPPAADARNPGGPLKATLNIVASPPTSESIRIPFTMTVGSDVKSLSAEWKAPADVWANDEVVTAYSLEIPPAELVFSAREVPGRKVRIEATGDRPDKPLPIDFVVKDSDERMLRGHILAVLVLTSNLTPAELQTIQAILDQAEKEGMRNRLVNGSLFVLDANGELSPFRLDALKDRSRFFKPNIGTEKILTERSKEIFNRVRDRLSEDDKAVASRVLLIRDIADPQPGDAAKAFSRGLPGKGWSIYWITPNPLERASFGEALNETLRNEFHFDLKIPKGDLSKQLLDFLGDRPPK